MWQWGRRNKSDDVVKDDNQPLSPISYKEGGDVEDLEIGETNIAAHASSHATPGCPRPSNGGHISTLLGLQGAVPGRALRSSRPGTSNSEENSRPSSGARSTRSQLPGETDNEDESDFLDVPDEMLTRSRPGSAPHLLVPVEESLSNSLLTDENISPKRDEHLLDSNVEAGSPEPFPNRRFQDVNTMPHFKMWYDKPHFKEQDQRDRESPSTLQGPLRGSSSASKDQPPLCSPTGILVLITSNVIIFVVILILVLVLVVFVSREEVCTKGEYFGKRLNASQDQSDSCIPCPLGQSSEGGIASRVPFAEEKVKCFCTSGYYTLNPPHTPAAPILPEKCIACERGLWTPSQVSVGRINCQRYEKYWRLGDYGANCSRTCASYNMSFDAPGLRLWEQRFSMPDSLNMIAFQIQANCSSIHLSYRNAGPFICSHPDCATIRGICYAPVPPIESDDSWPTPSIVRRFCPCYNRAKISSTGQ